MFLITTSNFSAGAIQYAQEVGVELINGSHLLVLLKQYGLVDKKDAPIYPSEWQMDCSRYETICSGRYISEILFVVF